MHSLKGLHDVISVVYGHSSPNNSKNGEWIIAKTDEDVLDDSNASLKSETAGELTTIHDMYQKEEVSENDCTTTATPTTGNNNTIPVLYDNHNECIVNNNVNDIVTMLNGSFNDFGLAENHSLDLLGGDNKHNDELAQTNKLNEVTTWLYPLLQLTPYTYYKNNNVVSQRELECTFIRASNILQRQRYLTSHTAITEADWRLFVTLVRYEEVYSKVLALGGGSSFSPPQLRHYPALVDFCRDIYQQPGVADTVCMKEIRSHFFGTRNTSGVVESGMLTILKMPHKRGLL